MQKVYLMSEFGTLFEPGTGEHFPVETSGRITAVCALRPEDVMGEYGYLAVVEQADGAGEKRFDEATAKRAEPVDDPLVRGMLPAVMIVNKRSMRVVN
ncbi:hypothetical protein TFLX_03115 [Thermoflexales bacterium]|nr:hypothetical protein TFLX_03115 [Thermoflexales bacterium]